MSPQVIKHDAFTARLWLCWRVHTHAITSIAPVAPLATAQRPAPARVVAIQGNAPNASFVVFKFSAPFYMDVVSQGDDGIGPDSSTGDRLAWATVKYGLAMPPLVPPL